MSVGKDGRLPSGRATAAEPVVSALRDGIPDARHEIWDAECPPCPFCDEDGFDLPGLAGHIDRHCEVAEVAREEQANDLQRWHNRMVERFEVRRAAVGETDAPGDAA